jgi:hypothetical protein
VRRFLAILLTLVCTTTFAHASAPALTDPVGDTYLEDAPYADLTGAWFTSTHNRDGALTAFQVHIAIAAPPSQDEEAAYQVDWHVDAGPRESCWGDVNVQATKAKENMPYITPMATLAYACSSDDASHSINLLFVSIVKSRRVDWGWAGAEAIVTVPVSVFEGVSARRYRTGARLINAVAKSWTVALLTEIPADDTCPPIVVGERCASTPYTL